MSEAMLAPCLLLLSEPRPIQASRGAARSTASPRADGEIWSFLMHPTATALPDLPTFRPTRFPGAARAGHERLLS